MKLDLCQDLVTLGDMPPATFFIDQKHRGSTFGMSMIDGGGNPGAILFTRAVTEGDAYPCLVSEAFLQNSALLPLPDAYLVPDLSAASLAKPTTTDLEGPGEIILSGDKRFFRCTIKREGFRYVDIESGNFSGEADEGNSIHIRMWKVMNILAVGTVREIFAFDGPTPIKL